MTPHALALRLAFLVGSVLLACPVSAQLPTAPPETQQDARTPRGALWRAAAVPGWGQLYNRQYWKVPLVYAGLGGLTATTLAVNQKYLQYRHAALYKADEEAILSGDRDENRWPQYADVYQNLINDIAQGQDLNSSLLRNQRDALRRNRDLLYVGIGLWYGFTILDAYVSAHLFDFDVGEDLSVRLAPHPHGLTATVRWAP